MTSQNFPECPRIGLRSFFRCYRIETLVFVWLFFTYAFFFHPGGHNAAARYDSIRSFLEQGTLAVDKYCYNSADLIKIDSHYYSSKAPGTFWLGLTPFFVASKLLHTLPENLRYQWVCYLTNVFSNALLSALTGVLIFRFVANNGATPLEGLCVVLALNLATLFFANASVFFSHNQAAACLFGSFYFLYNGGQRLGDNASDRMNIFIAGGLSGFAVTIEYPAALGASILLAYALFRGAWRPASLISLVFGVIGGLIPALIYNSLAFHRPFFITYSAYAQNPQAAFVAHARGVLGIRLPIFDFSFWPVFFSNLKSITIGPLRGLLYLNPVLIIAGAGLFLTRRSAAQNRLPEQIVCLSMVAVYLVFNASYGDSIVYWGGGYSFGPRHLTPLIPFLALPMLFALKNKILRVLFWPLLATSLFFCLMAVSIDPLTPYSPDHPIQKYYIPKFLDQAFAMDTSGVFSKALLTRDSVAFNLGKIVGLTGWMELLPLLVFWAGCFLVFWRLLQKPTASQKIIEA